MRSQSVVLCLAAASMWACAGSSTTTRGGGTDDAFTPDRAEVAVALARYDASEGDDARGVALAAAWRHRAALVDDTILRHLVRALPTVPDALAAAQSVEKSAAIAGSSEGVEEARAMLARIDDLGDDGTRWTEVRKELLEASLMPPEAEQQALLALRRAGRLNPVGRIGSAQRAQAWLMEGSIEHKGGRYKEAMAAYLKVRSPSGLWREARLGMAWCQLRIAQPDRAIASLALLPGGLTGDPERALVAAMAAGALGKIETARAVLDEARARARNWLDVKIDLVALVSQAMPAGASLRMRAPDEGLLERLTAHPAVRLFAEELKAARVLAQAQPARPELQAYVARLEAAWPGVVQPLIESEQDRVRKALVALDALEPQLR